MFSGFAGEGLFERHYPAHFAVIVALPVTGFVTGQEARFGCFMAEGYFDAGPDGAASGMERYGRKRSTRRAITRR